MGSIAEMDSSLKVITSSIRFRNSGRNVVERASWILFVNSCMRLAACSGVMDIIFSAISPMVSPPVA